MVTPNNCGESEPAGGWMVRATCPMHGSMAPAEATTRSVNPDDVIVHVPHVGFWKRLLRGLGGGKDTSVPEAPLPPIVKPEPSSTVWMPEEEDEPIETRDVTHATADAEMKVDVITEEQFDEAIANLTEEAEDLEPIPPEVDPDPIGALINDARFDAQVQAWIEEEVAHQLAERIAPRVKELLDTPAPKKNPRPKKQVIMRAAPNECKGRMGHWYSVYGEVGLRSPVCVRCGAPNPRFSDAEQKAWDKYEKKMKKK
jgi:hypothetical protein